jgi:GNAT superfamily N-acetyltransferase
VDSRYAIARARPQDVPALGAIERAAARLLRGHAPQSILDEVTDQSALRQAQAEGRLWVVLAEDAPVGFALIDMLADDLPHLDEIDVHPRHGRHGVGTALLRALLDWLAGSGYSELTLTTFRDVAWNMPFYARLGFEEVPLHELRPELAAVVEEETARGLDPRRRVVMRYRARGLSSGRP